MSARYQRLVAALVAEITSGARAPGTRMPSVRELARTPAPDGAPWGSSTAERAMRALGEAGWTTAAAGSGTYVADPLPGERPTLEQRVDAHDAEIAALKARLGEHERGHGEAPPIP
jgi:DNA-binding GntR family transcriptional regulator